ncbi:MAG: hypothetical protein H6Q31_536 [Bacteroidetes bacterium]|jgi:hypothetical protein|nr:hypothetical protein [Bacteroidota bacterium]
MVARRLIYSAVLLMAGAAVSAADTLDVHEQIVLHESGAADVTLTVLASVPPGRELVLPWSHSMPDSIRPDDTLTHAALRVEHGLHFLVLTAPWDAERPRRVRLSVPSFIGWSSLKRTAFGNVTVEHTFRNTTSRRIDRYRGDVILPEGYVVTSVVSSIPEQTEKDPVAPYEILEDSGRSGVSIRTAKLGLGDGALITFRCKPAAKSPILLVALILAGTLYLMFFRDVLKENGNGPPAAQNAQS